MQQRPPFDLNDFRPPRIPMRLVRIGIIVVLGFIFLYSTFFTVGPEEEGVILRLGKYVRTVGPGLHFKLPLGIEALYKVPVQRQLKEEFGFRTVEAGVRTRYSTRNYDEESLMLTGDLNIAVVEWVVQFRISDPYRFLFRVR
ncbi:MAG: FtsH protease activity modulator HflK, partial [Calditrichaeota bacterium]